MKPTFHLRLFFLFVLLNFFLYLINCAKHIASNDWIIRVTSKEVKATMDEAGILLFIVLLWPLPGGRE